MSRSYPKGTRKCACSLCSAQIAIPKRFCPMCLENCHTIMSAANSLDDIAKCDFSNIDWSSDTVRSQNVEHGGGFAAVQATDTAEGIFSETTDNGGDAMGDGMGGEDAAQAAAEAFAEAFANGTASDDDAIDADTRDGGQDDGGQDDGGQDDGGQDDDGEGSGGQPDSIYVITRRAYNLTDDEMRRGVVGTARQISVFRNLKDAQKFARNNLRGQHPRNKYRCKKIKLS